MIPSILPTYNRAPFSFVSGSGSWLTSDDGRRFLDLGAGIAVNSLGHAHPKLVAALTAQAGQLWHTSNLYHIPAQQKLADQLVDLTFADTVFFTNSGTESCELAVKMARKYFYDKGQPERVEIIAFEGAFSWALLRRDCSCWCGEADERLWAFAARFRAIAICRSRCAACGSQ